LGAIRLAIKLSPLNWSFHHIRGHQDDYLEFHDLDRDEQLNVIADTLAKQKLQSFSSSVNWRYKRPIHIPYEQCSIDWTDQFGVRTRISCHLQKSLQTHIQSVQARAYWVKKKQISQYHERQIDWKVFYKTNCRLPTHRHRWLSKWLTGFCGVGIMLQRYRHQHHSDCPRCGISGESTAHIIQCQENGARQLWSKEIQKLQQWMLTNDGHPEMTEIICSKLRHWQTLRHNATLDPSVHTVIKATTHQQQVGWFNFIQGFISMHWRTCQSEHLINIRSQKSALLWMTRFQHKLYLIVWEMWNHRNQLLHGAGDKIHITSLATIDTDIQLEWKRGMDTLPSRYANLFSGSLHKTLQLSPVEKKRWLTCIWAARDKFNGGLKIWDRSSNVDYDKWKARKTNNRLSTVPPTPPSHSSTRPTPLTIEVTTSSDEDDDALDTSDTSNKGHSPIASYEFSSDTNYLTTSIQSTHPLPSPGSAHTPTGISLQPQPVQKYIQITSNDRNNVIQFKNHALHQTSHISQFLQHSISSRSLHTTNDRQWLNDEVINFYLSTLNDHDHTQKHSTSQRRHHFFNSFFITKLLDEGNSNRYTYRNVLRWSRKVHNSDLFQLHKIFFPCNISQSHWSCVIADIQTCTITYYDSMLGNGDRYMHSILHYLQDDWMRTRGYDMPHVRQWVLRNDKEIPVQDNSYDCGVFVCLFATCMVLDCGMEFDQSDAPTMRMKLAQLIYTHRVIAQSPIEDVQRPQIQTTLPSESVSQPIISQDISAQPKEQSTTAGTTDRNTGYFTIMHGTQGVKRKFLNSSSRSHRKRHKANTRTVPRSKGTHREASTQRTQTAITTLFSPPGASRQKRKLSLTDEEHPFKHKRFKEDDED
jgi:hypothetical protein